MDDDNNALRLEPGVDGNGCNVKGTVTTDKVAGNFRFKVKPQVSSEENDARHLQVQMQAPHVSHYPTLDMSHEVRNIYFEGKRDIVSKLLGHLASPPTPLKNQVTTLDGGTDMYTAHYTTSRTTSRTTLPVCLLSLCVHIYYLFTLYVTCCFSLRI